MTMPADIEPPDGGICYVIRCPHDEHVSHRLTCACKGEKGVMFTTCDLFDEVDQRDKIIHQRGI